MRKRVTAGIAAALGLSLAGCSDASRTEPAERAIMALADRIAIEDLIARYYSHLGGQDADAYGAYFTEDGVFEVNGAVYNGREAIISLYRSMGGGVTDGATGLFHMLLTNPVIEVNGDTATATFIWTGIVNHADATQPPTLREQGREYDRLVKQDGKWLIRKRVVIADSGLPRSMLNSWKQLPDYDVNAP